MRAQVGFAIEDVEKRSIQQVVAFALRVVFDNDIFQLCQFLIDMAVSLGKVLDGKIIIAFPFEQIIDILENVLVLVFHVPAHFFHVFIVKHENRLGDVVFLRFLIERFAKFHANCRQRKIEEIAVGLL